jgi:hypothetical protein
MGEEMEFWCNYCEKWVEETRAWTGDPAYCKSCSKQHNIPWDKGFVPVRPKPKKCGAYLQAPGWATLPCVLNANHKEPHTPFKVGE